MSDTPLRYLPGLGGPVSKGNPMAKPIPMTEAVKAVRDAWRIMDRAIPGHEVTALDRAAVLPVLVRELLDNEYDDDL